MTLIPSGINQIDPFKNLARSIIGLASVATPADLTKVDPTQDLAAYPRNPGVKGYESAFWLAPNAQNPAHTDFSAELPLSSRIYGATLDQKKAVISLPSAVAALVPPVATPVALTVPAASLEQYCLNQATAVQATMNGESPDRKVTIKPMIEKVGTAARSYLKIFGTLDQSMVSLLTDGTVSGSQG